MTTLSDPGLRPVRDLASLLLHHLPRLTDAERRLGRTLYRLLAEGRPVRPERLATALDRPTRDVEALLTGPSLRGLVFRGGHRTITGFAGLATEPMHHQLDVDGVTLWTWCAWDSLFIPPLLETSATVTSPDPVTGAPVRLTVDADGVRDADPADAVLSFVEPSAADFRDDAHRTMAAFCHQIFFFATPDTAESWVTARPDTRIITLQEGFQLGRLLNRTRWGTP